MQKVSNIVRDAKEDMTMVEDIENRNNQMNIVEGDSEVMYLTPSKVIHCEPRKKMCAQKMKSSYVVTTETREQLKNTLSTLDKFDPKRPVPNDMTLKFFN